MNYLKIREFAASCELLGVSPFDAAGVQEGDMFTPRSKPESKLEFLRALTRDKQVGLFNNETLEYGLMYYYFTEVLPEKPYDFK